MFNPPLTLDEAKKYRYNTWAGNPKGTPYKSGRCAYSVWNNRLSYQCSKKAHTGPNSLYCGIHAKKVASQNTMETSEQPLTGDKSKPAHITHRCYACSMFGECEYTSVIKTGCSFFKSA